MGHALSLGSAGLGCADFEFANHGHGITIHNFAMKVLGKRERQTGLAASRWTDDNHQQRIGRGRHD
jgi:hypothetical protein